MLYLIVVELAEILHVHLALVRIGNSREAVEHHVLAAYILHGTDNIRKLAHTRGLDNYSVGRVFVKYL